jgi:hypothetical protein
MALLEGMLDRIRYFYIETSNGSSTEGGTQLADRLCRGTSRLVVSLLRVLFNPDASIRAPLLWHDVLLNSVTIKERAANTLHRALQHMYQSFDELDTKSTNL